MTRRTLIVALLAACGDDGGVRTLDDAPTLDVAPGSATVTLRLGRNPLPNHAVIFQGPDFTEIATVTTDASGTASAVVPAGSSVTVLGLRYIANPDIRSVVTVMGVKPGDHLTLNGTASFDQSQVDFTYPAYTGVATANYAIATTCGADAVGAGTTNSLGLDHCSPRIDTVIYARDETGSDPLAFVAKLDQPFAAMIDLTGARSTPMASPARSSGSSSRIRTTAESYTTEAWRVMNGERV